MENLKLQIINTLITLLNPLQASYPEVTEIINDLNLNKTLRLMDFIKKYYSTIPYNAKIETLANTLVSQGLLPLNFLDKMQITSNNNVTLVPNQTVESKEEVVNQENNVLETENGKEEIVNQAVENQGMETITTPLEVSTVNENTPIYKLNSNRPLNVKNNDFLNIIKNIKEKFKNIRVEVIDNTNCYIIDSLPLVKPEVVNEVEEVKTEDVVPNQFMEIQPTDPNVTSEEVKDDDLPLEFGATLPNPSLENEDAMSKVLEVTPSNGIPIGGNALSLDTPEVDMNNETNDTIPTPPEFEPFEVTSLHSLSRLNAGINDNNYQNNTTDNYNNLEISNNDEITNTPPINNMSSPDINIENAPYEPVETPLDSSVPETYDETYNYERENQNAELAEVKEDNKELKATIESLEEEKRKLEEEKENLKKAEAKNREMVRELERQKVIDEENDRLLEDERKRKEAEHAEELAKRDEILRKKILDAQLNYIDNPSKFIKDLKNKTDEEIYESLYNLYRIDYIYHCLSNSSTETLNRFLHYLEERMSTEKAYISIYMEQAIKKVLGTRAYQEENKKIA